VCDGFSYKLGVLGEAKYTTRIGSKQATSLGQGQRNAGAINEREQEEGEGGGSNSKVKNDSIPSTSERLGIVG